MTVIKRFLGSVGRELRRAMEVSKGVVVSIQGGLRAFARSPATTMVRWLGAISSGLIRLARWLLYLVPRAVRATWKWLENVTFGALLRLLFRTAMVAGAVCVMLVLWLMFYPNSQIPEHEPPDRTVYLDQGWGPSPESRLRDIYYYTPQGVGWQLLHMRYSWFVNLELPWGTGRFADPQRMAAYGFIVDAAPTPGNPDLLPVGFTKYFDPAVGDEVLDLTCAACHTGGLLATQKNGEVVAIRIDGGQAMHAATAMNIGHFSPVMLGSLASTYINPMKFKRFARKVLGEEHYETGKDELRKELWKTLMSLLRFGGLEKSLGLAPTEEGFGRTDAIVRIGNMAFGQNLSKDNYHVADSPVSFPPVWDIWKFDWVQYSASVAQPMARNLGETLGTGATYSLVGAFGKPLPKDERFSTTSRIEDIDKIERTLRLLRPPEWPEEVLGAIDQEKAAKGGLLFVRHCQECHGPHPASPRVRAIEAPGRNAEQAYWVMKTLDIYDIGTDPNAALNFVRNTYDLSRTGLSTDDVKELLRSEWRQQRDRELACDYVGRWDSQSASDVCIAAGTMESACIAKRDQLELEHEREMAALDLKRVTVGEALNIVGMLMRKKIYAEAGYSASEQQELNGFGMLDLPQVRLIYKARPLSGMWATPPFLHNGSVRNLYQLLSPVYERDREFYIGRREFDPKQVGFVVERLSDGGFTFDTTQPGNSNSGHEFRAGYNQWRENDPPQFGVIGPEFTPEERYQIIEYLKVHRDDDELPYSKVFSGVLNRILDTIGPEVDASKWQDQAAQHLGEYLGNHPKGHGDPAMESKIMAIRARLPKPDPQSGSSEQCRIQEVES